MILVGVLSQVDQVLKEDLLYPLAYLVVAITFKHTLLVNIREHYFK